VPAIKHHVALAGDLKSISLVAFSAQFVELLAKSRGGDERLAQILCGTGANTAIKRLAIRTTRT
jgi:hypothetical protein